MKIAIVSQGYPPETGGGGIGTQALVKAHGLAALGHSIFVISRSIDNDRHEKNAGNITVIRLPGLDAAMPEMTEIVQWITNSTLVAAELESLHNKIGLDLVDFAEWSAEGYIWLLNRTPWKSVSTVVQLHGPLIMLAHTIGWPSLESDFYKIGVQMEAECTRLADAVYSSSECSADWIKKFYAPGREEIPIIHLGIDTNHFVPDTSVRSSRPTIVFSGKLVKNKGVEELIKAASMLTHKLPQLQLMMIGRGEEKYVQYLEDLAVSLDAPRLLTLTGYIHPIDLPKVLCHANFFAAPSYYEGGPGFVYLEAMACGLPVIGCSGSGVEEIIQDGINGHLVPPRNSEELAMVMEKLLSDKKELERLGKQAREYVIQKANSKDCVLKLEAFYYSVLQKNKAVAE